MEQFKHKMRWWVLMKVVRSQILYIFRKFLERLGVECEKDSCQHPLQDFGPEKLNSNLILAMSLLVIYVTSQFLPL